MHRNPMRRGVAGLPAVRAVLDRALQALEHDERRTGCPHVRHHDTLFACAHHPAAGLSCFDCAAAHAARHAYAIEHGCDVCGAVGVSVHAIGEEHLPDELWLFDREGMALCLIGVSVWFVGVGACCGCVGCEGVAA